MKCRFCLDVMLEGNEAYGPAFINVCKKQDCQRLMQQSCDKILQCDHTCKGLRGEAKCLPCLDENCVLIHEKYLENTNQDAYCEICFSSGLGDMPCVQLDGCKHVFHFDCIAKLIREKWLTPRIVFTYLYCPVRKPECKKLMSFSQCPEL